MIFSIANIRILAFILSSRVMVFSIVLKVIYLINHDNESNSFKIFTGEDEDYKMCKKLQSVKYSPEATIKCQENKR